VDWNWDNLRYFLALARTPKLARAADRLGVSHTTVFRRIQRFETELDTRLFERTPDGHVLTPAGERLLAEVEKMEVALGTISREIVGADQRIDGTVVITTVDLLAAVLLPDVLLRLKQAHPGLAVHLKVGRELADLSRREADIAIRMTRAPPPQLVGRRLGQLVTVACASERYLEAHPTERFPATATGHRFVIDSSIPYVAIHRWLGPDIDPARVTTCDTLGTAVSLCLAGLGIAVLPRYLVDRHPELRVLATPTDCPGLPVWLLTHPDLKDTARIRVTTRFLFEELQHEFAIASG
jgi:DNA-binding transcriptional LysR family regulator